MGGTSTKREIESLRRLRRLYAESNEQLRHRIVENDTSMARIDAELARLYATIHPRLSVRCRAAESVAVGLRWMAGHPSPTATGDAADARLDDEVTAQWKTTEPT